MLQQQKSLTLWTISPNAHYYENAFVVASPTNWRHVTVVPVRPCSALHWPQSPLSLDRKKVIIHAVARAAMRMWQEIGKVSQSLWLIQSSTILFALTNQLRCIVMIVASLSILSLTSDATFEFYGCGSSIWNDMRLEQSGTDRFLELTSTTQSITDGKISFFFSNSKTFSLFFLHAHSLTFMLMDRKAENEKNRFIFDRFLLSFQPQKACQGCHLAPTLTYTNFLL